MEEELKQLAALALRNAFWHDFSALVNKYLDAAKGLDIDMQEMQMGEMTSVYGRDTEADFSDLTLNLWSANKSENGFFVGVVHHETIIDALSHGSANEVRLRGEKVFERRDGEWYFAGD